jgi:hypothetical protein
VEEAYRWKDSVQNAAEIRLWAAISSRTESPVVRKFGAFAMSAG